MNGLPSIPNLLLAASALVCAGCVSFPVSHARTTTFERLVESVSDGSSERVVNASSATPVVSVDAAGAMISIGLTGAGTYRKRMRNSYESFSIDARKRIALGFFPSFAEDLYRPDCSIRPAMAECGLGEVFLGWPLATVYSLLVVPFSDDYAHSCHGWEDEGAYNSFVALLSGLTQEERTRLGMPPRSHRETLTHDPAHLSIFGFFKYMTFVVHPPTPSRTVTQEESSSFKVDVHGPLEVELTIPELGYRMRNDIPSGDTRADFPIPEGLETRTLAAEIRFLDPTGTFGPFAGTNTPIDQKSVFLQAKGKVFPSQILLPTPVSRSVETVVINVDGRKKAHPVSFRLVEKKTLDGDRTRYRIEIVDKSQSAFDVDHVVRPDIVEELRETYLSKHPGVPVDQIHAWADYKVENGFLVYVGSAFSVHPTGMDSYSYDADTRKGSIRIRLGADADAEVARKWARDSISSIIRAKNLEIVVGTEPSGGESFRTLDERIDGDVLTVDFEAGN